MVPSVSRMRLQLKALMGEISKRGLRGSRESKAHGEGLVRFFSNLNPPVREPHAGVLLASPVGGHRNVQQPRQGPDHVPLSSSP